MTHHFMVLGDDWQARGKPPAVLDLNSRPGFDFIAAWRYKRKHEIIPHSYVMERDITGHICDNL